MSEGKQEARGQCGAVFFGVNKPCVREKGHTGSHHAARQANQPQPAFNYEKFFQRHSPVLWDDRWTCRCGHWSLSRKLNDVAQADKLRAEHLSEQLQAELDQPQRKAQPDSGEMGQTIRCGMCGDTGLQNDIPCPQRGCVASSAFQRGQQALAEKAAQLRQALEALADKMGERCGDHCSNTCRMCEVRNDLRLILTRSLASAEPPQQEINTPAYRQSKPPQGEAEKEGRE